MNAPNATNPLDVQVAGTHYKEMKIQPVEFIHANGIGFCEATAIKYLCRWKRKGGIEDLKKAKHFIDVLIELETRDEAVPDATGYSVKDGPYCQHCVHLADFQDCSLSGYYVCSNCLVERGMDPCDFYVVGRL